ncbi:ANTAR domain-containing response regulator [Streptomyces sp. GESEQ-35]|uniref:ANTAR domain-containing response regulator n=1 Tax=Streptomyces sp. GESEQ-35 TaxID=2812657 RepID=UPI001B31D8BA|nr:ANTAR domain-containing protein [Streptomyces sp. GESEQ-35]
MTPEQRLADAFVALAGSTTDGPLDVPGTLTVLAKRAPSLLGAGAAAVVFAPDGYEAAHVAGSDSDVSRLENAAVGWREGPGHDCHQANRPPPQTTLDSLPTRQRWPHYTPWALRLGYTRVAALPLREPTGTSGALVLLSGERQVLAPDALALGQSMADFTAVILERAREAARSRTLTEQLELALTGRVVIEQAKGVLAARWSVTPAEAFDLLRKHARARQRSVRDVAREVVEGHGDPDLAGPAQ